MTLSGRFVHTSIGEVLFGDTSLQQFAEVLARDGVKRVMLIASKSLVSNEQAYSRVANVIGSRLALVYTEGRAHNRDVDVLDALEAANLSAADALVTLGGTSQNELAKGLNLARLRGISSADQFSASAFGSQTVAACVGEAIPIYCLPTTLSAGEFTDLVGIRDGQTGAKQIYRAPELAARAIVLDPILTIPTPAELWLSSGVKAIDHCVEAMLADNAQPYTDALAMRAMKDLVSALPICRNSPNDSGARVRCQVAAWMSVAGLANVKLGLSHGLGHQLGAATGMPHGLTSCITLPPVVAFNLPATQAQQALIRSAVWGADDDQRDVSLADRLRSLIRDDLHLPWRLRDFAVDSDILDQVAKHATRDPLAASNPRKVRDSGELVDLLQSAW